MQKNIKKTPLDGRALPAVGTAAVKDNSEGLKRLIIVQGSSFYSLYLSAIVSAYSLRRLKVLGFFENALPNGIWLAKRDSECLTSCR